MSYQKILIKNIFVHSKKLLNDTTVFQEKYQENNNTFITIFQLHFDKHYSIVANGLFTNSFKEYNNSDFCVNESIEEIMKNIKIDDIEI